ncbi:DUF5696 domain-containing protein [Paenibacillus sp. GCM10012307]|uniref:Uncharacterized protein n=1 Tax=Paenibacillus roseus TaxID=2798579 RepID=A0A934J891_9BACL|nr:DUF5696 domain-containing protein [Paenibacillus roseus]MBJ6362242.1 hypothetical protein [Paenibacillus roseus]
MFKLVRHPPVWIKLSGAILLIVIALLLIILSQGGEMPMQTALEKTGIAKPQAVRAPLYEGQEWKPAAGPDGYALAAENASYALYAEPASSRIAVLDKRTGFRWTSNPSKEQLEREKVKGGLLANLQSPFVLTYVRTEGKDQTIREVVNALDPKVKTTMVKSDQGLQVAYQFPEKGITLTIQYELTDKGLKARLPGEGMKEEGEFAVFSVDLLPYFGAASPEENGYLFVPDGPGGLIYFDRDRANVSKGYIHQVYGLEITNVANWSRSGERRENIAYPVFGVKRGDHAFMAVLSAGGDSASIAAMPPGLKSSLYNVYSNQIYREEYLYRTSRLAAPLKAVQKQRLDTDREVEFRFLSGKDAGYVGMANAYRDYLTEHGKLAEPLASVDHMPLRLKIMGGNYAQAFSQIRYITATTFSQAGDIVDDLKRRGIANLSVIYYGWQQKGDYDKYRRFPIESSLGGEQAAREFISKMKAGGVPVLFEEDFVWLDPYSSLSGKTNGIRGIEGTVFVDEDWYISKPARTVAMAYETIDKLKDIGVSGIHFNWIGELVFHDYDVHGISTRADTIGMYNGLLGYTRRTLGQASVYQGNDYTLNQTDYIANLSYESSYDFMVDETVPFYPIVLHGRVPYSFDDSNLRNDVQEEFLKAIEYGAVPSYFLTHDDSRKLRYSASGYLYSTRYDKWADRIQEEYEAFDALAGLYAQQIVNHERLSADRFATTYEDGTRVIVDYGRKTFEVEKGAGA